MKMEKVLDFVALASENVEKHSCNIEKVAESGNGRLQLKVME